MSEYVKMMYQYYLMNFRGVSYVSEQEIIEFRNSLLESTSPETADASIRSYYQRV